MVGYPTNGTDQWSTDRRSTAAATAAAARHDCAMLETATQVTNNTTKSPAADPLYINICKCPAMKNSKKKQYPLLTG